MNKYPSPSARWLIIGLVAVVAVGSALAVLNAARATAASVQTHSVGLIIDPSGLDNYFNRLAATGLERAEDKLDVSGTVYTPTTNEDIITRTQECVDDGNELCIGVGYVTSFAISQTAQANPGVKFALLDSMYEDYTDNLQGIRFAVEEPSYMAGTLAGLMTASDKLGVVGGLKIPPVDDFIDGFQWGAQCINPSVTTTISYTNDFNDPDLGAIVAQEMISDGADLIFPVAGSTGVGAILTATQSGAWAIGVDTDQWETVFMSGTITGSEKLLTSVIKRMDSAVFMLISDTISSTFISGTVNYDLESGMVDLAPYHEAEVSVPPDVTRIVERIRRGILNGIIDVNGPCPTHIYMPVSPKDAIPGEE